MPLTMQERMNLGRSRLDQELDDIRNDPVKLKAELEKNKELLAKPLVDGNGRVFSQQAISPPEQAAKQALQDSVKSPFSGYQNPGNNGAALFSQPNAATTAFEAALAPSRKAPPPTYGAEAFDQFMNRESSLRPGRYIDIGGGRSAHESDLAALASSGNTGAFQAMRNQARQDAVRLANANPVGGGFAVGPGTSQEEMNRLFMHQNKAQAENVNQSISKEEAALAHALSLGDKAFDQDTKRAEAQIREYDQKITHPERNKMELEKERMRDESEMNKASLAGKLSMTNQESMEYQEAVKNGASPAQLAAIRDTWAAKRAEYENAVRGKTGRVGQASAGGQTVAIDQRPDMKADGMGSSQPQPINSPVVNAVTGKPETPEEARQRITQEDQVVNDLLSKSMGEKGKESYSPERIASALARQNLNPRQMDAFLKAIKNKNFSSPDSMIGGAMKHRVLLARRAGDRKINDNIELGTGNFNGLTRDVTATIPGLGALTFAEPAGIASFGQKLLGTGDLFSDANSRSRLITGAGQEEAAAQAEAIGKFVEALIRSGRLPPQ